MRTICTICGEKVTEFRTSHLKAHGIDTFPGAIRLYFQEEIQLEH